MNEDNNSEDEVLIGLDDGVMTSEEAADPYFLRIGGSPVWPVHPSFPSEIHKGIDISLRKCHICDEPLSLICQVNCPTPTGDYDRIIYVFACNCETCSAHPEYSWAAFRITVPAVSDTVTHTHPTQCPNALPPHALNVVGESELTPPTHTHSHSESDTDTAETPTPMGPAPPPTHPGPHTPQTPHTDRLPPRQQHTDTFEEEFDAVATALWPGGGAQAGWGPGVPEVCAAGSPAPTRGSAVGAAAGTGPAPGGASARGAATQRPNTHTH